MKILQLSLAYAPSWRNGGPPRVMFDYARELSRIGHEVSVYTSSTSSQARLAMGAAWPSDLIVHSFRPRSGVLERIYWNYSAVELWRWFEKNLQAFDIAHLAQTRTIVNAVFHAAASYHHLPYALSSFGSLPSRGSLVKQVYDQCFTNRLVRNASALLAQTQHEAEVYREFAPANKAVHIVPLAFDGAQFSALPPRGAFRSHLGLTAESKLVLYLGRLHQTKGVPTLLEGFRRALDHDRNLTLAIVGDDVGGAAEIASTIVSLGLSSHVRVCPGIYDLRRLEAYVDADAYAITPRVFEETPLAAIEALACGTTVLTNTRASVPGLAEANAGLVVDSDHPDVIATALLSLVSRSPESAQAHRAHVREFAYETFELRAVVRNLATVFAASLSGR